MILNFVTVHRFPAESGIQGQGKDWNWILEMLVKNVGFATSLWPSTMFQICGDVEAVGFPVQNAYKMAYDDENTTFEPVNAY